VYLVEIEAHKTGSPWLHGIETVLTDSPLGVPHDKSAKETNPIRSYQNSAIAELVARGNTSTLCHREGSGSILHGQYRGSHNPYPVEQILPNSTIKFVL